MMFLSSNSTCSFVLFVAAAWNAVTVAAKEVNVELPEVHQPALRGNSPTTIAATPVESLAETHSRKLGAYEGKQGDLAVQSGAGLTFTHPSTEIMKGNVCGVSFTGLEGLDHEYVLGEGGIASTGGCDKTENYLHDLHSAAMDKQAKPMKSGEMGGQVITPGTYFAASLTIAANTYVTLRGTSTDIFLFQSGSAMVSGINTRFILQGVNGEAEGDVVDSRNILFALTAAATTSAGSALKGSILAGAAATLGANSSVSGYVLAKAAITVGAGCAINTDSIVANADPDDDVASPIMNLINKARCLEGDGSTCI
jgi:hypothetical protein